MIRWQLHDPVAGDTWTFPQNPNAMTSLARPHKTTSFVRSPIDNTTRLFRPADVPHTWTFTGRLRSQAHYDALDDWCSRSNRVQLTDHLGRVHSVLLGGFVPIPVERNGRPNAPWQFNYTVTTTYYGRV